MSVVVEMYCKKLYEKMRHGILEFDLMVPKVK